MARGLLPSAMLAVDVTNVEEEEAQLWRSSVLALLAENRNRVLMLNMIRKHRQDVPVCLS